MLKPLFAVLVLLALGLPASLLAQEIAASDPGLQPGDLVEITVWQRDELSGEFTVAQDGSLVHPLYRQVHVTGLPASQVEDRLRSFLGQFEANPQVVVRPLYKVAVAGQVFKPDIYTVQPGTTVSQVVTQAGGVTETADTDDAQLTRGTRVTEIDLRDLATIQMPVQSGDQILVKAKGGAGLAAVVPWIRSGLLFATILWRVNR
ncbi:MAG TPA: polysaccharide biosynthesis/export family protein [Gemmatimonadota bacterium]|nr:polysaccharide biosynthesis/export family protein [Gemmatimonadota bacterium]